MYGVDEHTDTHNAYLDILAGQVASTKVTDYPLRKKAIETQLKDLHRNLDQNEDASRKLIGFIHCWFNTCKVEDVADHAFRTIYPNLELWIRDEMEVHSMDIQKAQQMGGKGLGCCALSPCLGLSGQCRNCIPRLPEAILAAGGGTRLGRALELAPRGRASVGLCSRALRIRLEIGAFVPSTVLWWRRVSMARTSLLVGGEVQRLAFLARLR